ncbi:hypothetical protein OYC64_008394 [Pagothenia borchgrevinki]|uniref:Extensin-like n=1 Tax=Pagothenia borchgrevinki TaxID=8213 RepID=A0ABD2G4J3_PAGBO
MIILQQHYKNTLHTPTPSPFNPLAFQIATGWARKRYGPRLTQETVTTVQNSLNSSPSHLPIPSPYPKTPHPIRGLYPNLIPYPDPKSFCPTQGSYSNLVLNPKPLQASQQSLREPPLPPYPKPKGLRSPQQSLWSPPLPPSPKPKDPSLITPIQESPPLPSPLLPSPPFLSPLERHTSFLKTLFLTAPLTPTQEHPLPSHPLFSSLER